MTTSEFENLGPVRGGMNDTVVDGEVVISWSPEAVRAAERAAGDALSDGTLMQRAAAALADVVAGEVRARRAQNVVVLVGPGNNGGDALFAACDLARDHDIRPVVVTVAEGVHEAASLAVREAGLTLVDASRLDGAGAEMTDDAVERLRHVARLMRDADVVVDGVLGIGARAGGDAPWSMALTLVPAHAFVVAVDCPTPGLVADRTVTFGAPKTSLMLDPTATGEVVVADIGLPRLGAVDAERLDESVLASLWRVPGPHDHKYTRGVVGLATGSDAFPGAAVLGAVAAATAGAGMVRYVGPTRASDAVLAAVPEATHGVGRVQAWVVGSGMDGPSERDKQTDRYGQMLELLAEDVPVVLDAGALSWIDDIERPRGSMTVITPHAGELATLLAALGVHDDAAGGDDGAVTREVIEGDPVRWARRAAQETGFCVLLKGGATVIADPGRSSVLVENRASAWLATAGTGDVLAALVGVTLASGLDAPLACALAAYVHGQAAHAANPGGPVRALDVASSLGGAVAQLIGGRAH